MCGIVGVILKNKNGLFKKQEDSFFQMLYADALRGKDSTGIIAVENNTNWHIAKEAKEAAEFVPAFKLDSISNAMWKDGKAYIGHNRKKTIGDIKDETAHPFTVDDTFGMVHNGTLYNWQTMADKPLTDSHALAQVLKKAFDAEDHVAALEETLGKVYGAYALAMYDQKKHKVHLLRNKERPLSLLETDDAFYFASEAMMAGWILARNGYEFSKVKVTHIPEHILFSFDLETNALTEKVLIPKKAAPPSTKHFHTVVGGKTTTKEPITDTAFKKLKRRYLGKRISFWADDYVEKHFPNTVDEDGETEVIIFGDNNDEIDFAHNVQVEVDLKVFGITSAEDITNRKWSVRVDELILTEGGIVIKGIDAKAIEKLNITKIQGLLKDRKKFVEQLREMNLYDLEVYQEENRFKLDTWQTGTITSEINSRTKYISISDAWEAAKKEGKQLRRKTLGGHTLHYVDDNGKVYYEGPLTVH